MLPRLPDDDDPTSAVAAPPFDGTHTDQADHVDRLDKTDRLRSVATSETSNRAVGWSRPLGPASGDATDTYVQIKTPEKPALGLKDELPAAPEPARKTRYNPESGAGGGTVTPPDKPRES